MSIANSYHDWLIRLTGVVVLGLASEAWCQVPDIDIEVQKTLPITLDADSSEFDRQNDRLRFRGLRITQGALGIEADEAEATRLDFENSRWVFTGNVIIDSEDTRAYCDNAEMVFQEYRLSNAVLRGEPARFEQDRVEDGKLTEGRARTMEYDMDKGIIRMLEDAWLSDGASEVSGARITYDLTREYIIADADETGQVRMKINPPEKDNQ